MFSAEQFGQRLRQARQAAGETQAQLGAVLGLKKSQISELEKGSASTTLEKVALICTHYHISADYLLGLDGQMEEAGGREGGTGQEEGTI